VGRQTKWVNVVVETVVEKLPRSMRVMAIKDEDSGGTTSTNRVSMSRQSYR
jgi:hypothetical protein